MNATEIMNIANLLEDESIRSRGTSHTPEYTMEQAIRLQEIVQKLRQLALAIK